MRALSTSQSLLPRAGVAEAEPIPELVEGPAKADAVGGVATPYMLTCSKQALIKKKASNLRVYGIYGEVNYGWRA